MKLEIKEFEAVKGFKSFQLLKGNLIVAVVTGLSDEENLENAKLFANAENTLKVLKEANNTLKMASLIDKSDICENMQKNCEKVLK